MSGQKLSVSQAGYLSAIWSIMLSDCVGVQTRDLAKSLGVAPNAAFGAIRRLETLGVVRVVGEKNATKIRPIDAGPISRLIPVVGGTIVLLTIGETRLISLLDNNGKLVEHVTDSGETDDRFLIRKATKLLAE